MNARFRIKIVRVILTQEDQLGLNIHKYLFFQLCIVREKTLHNLILGRHLFPQLSDDGLGFAEHDLLNDVVVGGVVEEEVVDDRPTRRRAAGEGAAWLAPTHVQTPQELEPEAKIFFC